MFEHILSHLAAAQGCMERIEGNLPLNDVVAKGKAMGKAIRLINQLNATLDMERGARSRRTCVPCTCTCWTG
jgi:flagellin-specific chaperone FliS